MLLNVFFNDQDDGTECTFRIWEWLIDQVVGCSVIQRELDRLEK